MSLATSPSTHRTYGVLRVTQVWGASRATVYRHRWCDEPRLRRRPGPVGPMPDEALVEAIRTLLATSPFHGEGYRKIWARLRFAGVRTSKRRVLRLTREHGLQAPGRVGRPHGPRGHDGTIRTERVDTMWGSDLTSTMTDEGQASIFVTVDHCSTECVGIHAARRATRFEALEPLRQGVRACFGAFAEGIADGLKLRHDHGSQFVADDYQDELDFLGIESSPAFVREPEGNGCVERFIRTLKENLLWVRRFATIEELRQALHAFKDTYNRTWIVERHGYQTPAAVRAAQLAPLPAAASISNAVSHNC
jgi:putative transposase